MCFNFMWINSESPRFVNSFHTGLMMTWSRTRCTCSITHHDYLNLNASFFISDTPLYFKFKKRLIFTHSLVFTVYFRLTSLLPVYLTILFIFVIYATLAKDTHTSIVIRGLNMQRMPRSCRLSLLNLTTCICVWIGFWRGAFAAPKM